MATIKIILRKNYQKKDKTFPIVLRLTKDRKSKYLFTGEYILKKDWDETKGLARNSHPNSARLNNMLLKKLSEAHDAALKEVASNNKSSVSTILKRIKCEDEFDFFQASEIFLENILRRKKFDQHYNQKKRLIIFKEFLGCKKLFFTDLDVKLLKKFEAHLLYERKVSPRTAVNYLILIRTVYNLARKEYHVEDSNYPFGKGKIQIKFPESEKIGLTKEEIKLLEGVSGLSEAQQNAVNTWLISFYFAGIRVGDVIKLKWSDIKDGRLYYRMGKNKKLVSLSIPAKAKGILHQYVSLKKGQNGLIFPYLKDIDLKDNKRLLIRVKTITRNLNRRLKMVAEKLGIEKKLSMHIARHSFGNISADKIPIQMLQKLYRHSSITTTVNYQSNFMHKETDDALEMVINF
ncbi:tyrosine-type recombinase/integrase [Arenibacter sp. 6A1]|uniref:site-specific integrase n=1 Tax=Arenibacter sp. 6A1 TaxID=2720391 RepID=UPI001448409A|nr:site-specific integrase [Arenibacter sp. 6A1]NKI27853.1 tyrosine-type recombinase/integrase [Arenibacter sp. 6A1]